MSPKPRAREGKTMALIGNRDAFGNPVLNYSSVSEEASLQSYMREKLANTLGTDEYAQSMTDAIYSVWLDYGLSPSPYDPWDGTDGDATRLVDWANRLTKTIRELWVRYSKIVDAYETKIDWSEGIVNETIYNDVKDSNESTGEATAYALPNKSVSAPYGTPTGHNDSKGATTSVKSGSVTSKGMLNPVSQRDLYARLLRDAWDEMARECEPLFCTMHA